MHADLSQAYRSIDVGRPQQRRKHQGMGIQGPSTVDHLPLLIVDPNPSAVEPIATCVKDLGFEVDVATSCWGARGAAHRKHYRTLVVVADLTQAADLECLDELRREVPRTWIIAVSVRRYPDPCDAAARTPCSLLRSR